MASTNVSRQMIAPDVIAELARLCWEESPKETCGVLLSRDGLCYEWWTTLRNYAPDPTTEFWMDPGELSELTHLTAFPFVATWHTHPTTRWDLSWGDREVMQQTQLPMAIVAVMPYPSVTLYDLCPEGIVVRARYKVEDL